MLHRLLHLTSLKQKTDQVETEYSEPKSNSNDVSDLLQSEIEKIMLILDEGINVITEFTDGRLIIENESENNCYCVYYESNEYSLTCKEGVEIFKSTDLNTAILCYLYRKNSTTPKIPALLNLDSNNDLLSQCRILNIK